MGTTSTTAPAAEGRNTVAVDDELMDMLKQNGMVLVRSRKHQIWKHPDGRSFVMASTPSDFQAVHQQIRSLRKFLGQARPERRKNTEKKRKQTNHEQKTWTLTPSAIPVKPTWQGQLAAIAKEIRQSETK